MQFVMKRMVLSLLAVAVLVFGAVSSEASFSGGFVVPSGETYIYTESLTHGETGLVEANGAINVVGYTGVIIVGDNNTLTNNGEIICTGDCAGVDIWYGLNNTIINSGTISGMVGIYNSIDTSDTTINNSGVIYGSYAGVQMDGGTLNNSGIISSPGKGVMFNGGTLNNSGIIATVDDYAIFDLYWGDSTLNLYSGSAIYGAIYLGVDDYDIVNIYGGTSQTLDFQGADEINVFGGAVAIVNGNVVNIIDPSGNARLSTNIASLTSSLHGVLASHLSHIAQGGKNHARRPLQVAALELAPGMLHRTEPPKAWMEVFGFKRESEASSSVAALENKGSGVVFGYEFDRSDNRIGVTGGFASSSAETSDVKSVETDTLSVFLGGYGLFHLGKANLTASIIAGIEQHDNTRYVIYMLNTEKAKADYSSYFVSPSVTLASALKAGEFELRPSATVNYVMAKYDGYKEKGTTVQNLKVKDYDVNALTGSVQLAVAMVGESAELEIRGGLRSRKTDADEVSANLSGVNFKYGAATDDRVSGAYGGVFVRYGISNRASLTLDVEVAKLGGGEEKETVGTVGFDLSF